MIDMHTLAFAYLHPIGEVIGCVVEDSHPLVFEPLHQVLSAQRQCPNTIGTKNLLECLYYSKKISLHAL